MIDLGKIEAGRLREAIAELLAKIANGAIPRDGATSMEVARLIDSAERRIADIESKDETARGKEREEDVRNLAIAYKVEQEAKLNAEEKRQYGEFLKKEYFTKDDFGNLESFYTNSYDKLTDGGKAEMSTRVWEGVRRKEYEFNELPEPVKEKEALRLYFSLSEKQLDASLKRIPQSDRHDFVREWDAGNKEAAYQILNQKDFADNVSLSSKRVQSIDSGISDKSTALEVANKEAPENPKLSENDRQGIGDLTLGLDDVMLVPEEGSLAGAPLGGTKGSAKGKGG